LTERYYIGNKTCCITDLCQIYIYIVYSTTSSSETPLKWGVWTTFEGFVLGVWLPVWVLNITLIISKLFVHWPCLACMPCYRPYSVMLYHEVYWWFIVDCRASLIDCGVFDRGCEGHPTHGCISISVSHPYLHNFQSLGIITLHYRVLINLITYVLNLILNSSKINT
jgi:hypothetical protein